MGRPKTVSDDAIRETARRCFLEHGPSLSIATIAGELGISDAAILKRVGSKEALLRQCLLQGEEALEWLTALQHGPQPGLLKPQLVALLEQASAAMVEYIPTLVALRLSGLDVVSVTMPPGHLAPPLRARRELSAWLTHAAESHDLCLPDTDVVANLLLSTAESHAFRGWISSAEISGKLDWDGLVAAVLSDLSSGM